jgi:hypothetical protein
LLHRAGQKCHAKTFRRFGVAVFVTFATVIINTIVNVNANANVFFSGFLEFSTKQFVAPPILRSKQGGPTLELDGHRTFLALLGCFVVVVFELVAAAPPGFVKLAGHVFDLQTDLFPVGHFVPTILLGVPDQIPANIIGVLGAVPAFLEPFPKYFAGQLFGSFHDYYSRRIVVAVVVIMLIVTRLGDDHGPELCVPRLGHV